jgi:AraC-like DNA-binding protein
MHILPFRVGTILQHFTHSPAVPSPRRPILARESEFLVRMQMIAEEHIADPRFTTTDAAACLAMSRMHLNRLLRSLTGQSTHQFIQALRLESARMALLSLPLPVAEIAQRAGFKSTSHFTKAFRLRFGVPPAQYRRQNPLDPTFQAVLPRTDVAP